MAYITRTCANCGKTFQADTRNVARGWAKCCSKSCAAALREKEAKESPEKKRCPFDEPTDRAATTKSETEKEAPRRLTYDELVARANADAPRAKPRHAESAIQRNCVAWFRLQYPRLRLLLFAVPNGGARNKREAGIMKGEGVTAGVADMILLKPSSGFASLCVEFKTPKGRQEPTQKEWQKEAEAAGNKYVIVRSFEDFKREVEAYLNAG